MDVNVSLTEKSLPLMKGVGISVIHHHFRLMNPKNGLQTPVLQSELTSWFHGISAPNCIWVFKCP